MASRSDVGQFTEQVSKPGIGKEEQPPFRSLLTEAPPPNSWKWSKDGVEFSIEAREYPPMVVAETPYLKKDGGCGCLPCSWCQSPERRIRGAAFFRLAGYIGVFSEFRCIGRFFPPQNTSKAAGADAKQTQAMAMTAPVQLQPKAMAMTAPVAMTPPVGGQSGGGGEETMAFVLPFQQYPNLAVCPEPKSEHVTLKEKPGGLFAVLQAHGPKKMVPELYDEHDVYAKMLREKLGEHVVFAGQFSAKEGAVPEILGYNDPMQPKQTRELLLPLERK